MKKSVKIIISVLAIVLICAISFDVLLVNNSKQETPANTTQNIENQATESEEKTYSNPVEAQARKMVENMTLYEKVGQMLLYYIPKEEPLKKMARWQFGGYILFLVISKIQHLQTLALKLKNIKKLQKFLRLWLLMKRAAV